MKTPFIHILWMFKCQVSQHVEKLAKEMVALQVALRPWASVGVHGKRRVFVYEKWKYPMAKR
jgi:hypothetical protein